jgi:hypothetical protein
MRRMDAVIFSKLPPEQKWAMVIALAVRDALERFHGNDHGMIPDSAMPELNRRVRHAILTTVYCLMHFDKPGCRLNLDNRVSGVPHYWEIPRISPRDQDYFDRGDDTFIGRPAGQHDESYHTWFTTGQFPDGSTDPASTPAAD